ncbi:MAG: efflux RND transporter periplasmic adaptor subunit [Methyloligellaceae bacterium]
MTTENENKPVSKRRGIRPSYLWALFFLLLVGGWFLSNPEFRQKVISGADATINRTGEVDSSNSSVDGSGNPKLSADKSKTPDLFLVKVETIKAKTRENFLQLRGRTEAVSTVHAKAETAGIVQKLPAIKGSRVREGDILCQLEPGARSAQIVRTVAQLEKAKADLNASSKLESRGFTGMLRVKTDKAQLDSAQADLEAAELDLERTKIKAAFEGIVEEQMAKVGDYLNVGDPCAMIVTFDPVLIVGTVSERSIALLKTEMPAFANLVTGETVEGTIRFVSGSANPDTRTFRIEIEVQNPDNSVRNGVTANIRIPLPSAPAHQISPALLSLNDQGKIGVRIVTADSRVKFVPIRILSDGNKGVWIAGLPESVRIITVGQDYVVNGQKVRTSDDESATAVSQKIN